jgi:hypothetical protein
MATGKEQSIAYGVGVHLERRSVTPQMFKAVNDACLVFDGRLVVSNQFQTNDERIYGAGPFTKFSRKYHPPGDAVTHAATFNAKEVGAYVASIMLGHLDPLADEINTQELLLPRFTEPLVQSIELVDGRRLLRVGQPGAAVSPTITERGAVIQTDSGKFSRKLFELRFDLHRNASGMVCVATDDKLSVDNLICLYGQHEKLMNKVLSRHAEGTISDLFDYFNQVRQRSSTVFVTGRHRSLRVICQVDNVACIVSNPLCCSILLCAALGNSAVPRSLQGVHGRDR